MKDPIQRHTIIFIIRVWAEYLEGSPALLRGEIERVDTGEIERFLDPPQILAAFLKLLKPSHPLDPQNQHEQSETTSSTRQIQKGANP